jgi:hypothetical protein
VNVPDALRDSLRKKLAQALAKMSWPAMSPPAKSRQYEVWVRDPEIGGALGHYMDQAKIRTYIKDTLLKACARELLASDATRVLTALGISNGSPTETYTRPHGRRLKDGRIACWGRAEDWKLVVLACYERAFSKPGAKPMGVVLLRSVGKFCQEETRRMIEAAAAKLGIEQVKWLD